MAKARKRFVCRSCGAVLGSWMGRCPECGAWDSLEEDRAAAVAPARTPRAHAEGDDSQAKPIGEVRGSGTLTRRLATGLAEFDRVLGGSPAGGFGLVPGSAVLIGGEPGIGKSTLLLQAAAGWAETLHTSPDQPDWTGRVLYVSSEESAEQVRLRAGRLGAEAAERLYVLAETDLSVIADQSSRLRPAVLIIDSVQMVSSPSLDAAPGSLVQLRRVGADLVRIAKTTNTAVVMVGHVTKEGQLAGPRVLEHLVDAVLSFEGERHHAARVVRAAKNRFGTTQEVGLFEMGPQGLAEAASHAGPLAGEHEPRPGTVVCPALAGTRCVLVEVQALTATGFLGAAKRKCSGLDTNRLAMIIAVLEQHAELRLADRDVFASAVGGVRVTEPGGDLALLLAIAGAHFRRTLDERTVVYGEVGLDGRVRPVPQAEARLREAAKRGFTHAVVPAGSAPPVSGITCTPVKTLHDAIACLG